MGRKNKKYFQTLHQQAYKRLVGMQAFGESKRASMAEGTAKEKIFSFNTYKTYWKHSKYFLAWVKKNHPECTTLKSTRKYANEWLKERENQGLSAWTIHTEAKSVGKLLGITPDDPDYFVPPERHRADIKRSRVDCARDLHFSKTNNDELIKFCQGTGLRRRELEALRGRDLMTRGQIEEEISQIEALAKRTPEQNKHLEVLRDTRMFDSEYFCHVRNGKGGRERISPIVGKNVTQVMERMRDTAADQKVWLHVNSNADIHSYRSDYAMTIYRSYAREIEQIPYDRVNAGTGHRYQSEVYVCRKDEAGRRLDKFAMTICSKALGHNRIGVVANNYIRGL